MASFRERRRSDGAVFGVALRAVLEDDLDAAEQALVTLVREDSGQVEAYLLLAQLYRRRGEIGRAIRIHQNLLLRQNLEPAQKRRAFEGLARDFQRGGFFGRARDAWREVLRREPQHEAALRALVRLATDLRDFDGALQAQRQLSKRKPGDDAAQAEARLLLEKARAARDAGQSDEARKTLKRALRRDPKNARAVALLGVLEAERARHGPALEAWQRAITLDGRVARALYPKIEASVNALGAPGRFEELLRGWLPDNPSARLALAEHLAARGDTEAALAELECALEDDPESFPFHGLRARVLLLAGRDVEAVKCLKELLRLLERSGQGLKSKERLE